MSSDTAFLLGAAITDSNLVECSAAEPDPTRVMPDGSVGEVLFNPATNYVVGTYVCDSVSHRIYKNAVGGVNAAPPHTAPTRWTDEGPSNRWAWADWYRSTKTIAEDQLSVTVKPGGITDVVFFGISGAYTIRVQVWNESGGTLVYDETFSLLYWPGGGDPWVSYYFDLPQFREQFEVNDLPAFTASEVKVTLTGPTGFNVGIGTILFGRYQIIGAGQYGASARQRPFRKFDTDDFGNVRRIRLGLASDIKASAYLKIEDANAVKRAVDAVIDSPVALRIAKPAQYDFLRGFGSLEMEIQADGPFHCMANLELKGFK